MNETAFSILIFILGLILGLIAMFFGLHIKNKMDKKQAESIIDKAKKEAEKNKKNSIFETKEEIHKLKLEAEKEIKEKKSEMKESEDRLLQRENNIDKRDEALQKRESALDERENHLLDKQKEIQEIKDEMEKIREKELKSLEEISKFSKEKAHDEIMLRVEENMSKEIANYIKERESEAKLEMDEKAKNVLVNCIQKYAADVTNEQTVSVISLPNDEMKGRIIGREG